MIKPLTDGRTFKCLNCLSTLKIGRNGQIVLPKKFKNNQLKGTTQTVSGIVSFLPSLLTSSLQWLWAELLSDLWNVNLSIAAADAVTRINLNSVDENVSKDTNFSFLNHLQFFQRFSAQLSLQLEIYFSFLTLDFQVEMCTIKDTTFSFK